MADRDDDKLAPRDGSKWVGRSIVDEDGTSIRVRYTVLGPMLSIDPGDDEAHAKNVLALLQSEGIAPKIDPDELATLRAENARLLERVAVLEVAEKLAEMVSIARNTPFDSNAWAQVESDVNAAYERYIEAQAKAVKPSESPNG